jgi:hypothetical protein
MRNMEKLRALEVGKEKKKEWKACYIEWTLCILEHQMPCIHSFKRYNKHLHFYIS